METSEREASNYQSGTVPRRGWNWIHSFQTSSARDQRLICVINGLAYHRQNAMTHPRIIGLGMLALWCLKHQFSEYSSYASHDPMLD